MNSQIEESKDLVCNEGEIIVKVDAFSYSTNNITYAVTGFTLNYWQFFPVDETSGIIPVWGMADVIASKSEDIPVGDRLFGYFPSATHLVMKPAGVTPHRMIDGADHRRALPVAYNMYSRVLAEPNYDRRNDDYRMLLFPLFMTSYCIWDALQEKDWYQVEQIIILSASSKTSIGLAYALAIDEESPDVVALTSTKNVDMVHDLKLYDSVSSYDDIDQIDYARSTVIVDMSGNGRLLSTLVDKLGDKLQYSIRVGITHLDQLKVSSNLDQKKSEFFFAPAHMQMRMKEWGPKEFQSRTSTFLQKAVIATKDWLSIEKLNGLKDLQKVHIDLCDGKVDPSKGIIIKM